jgi:hypothetical protein
MAFRLARRVCLPKARIDGAPDEATVWDARSRLLAHEVRGVGASSPAANFGSMSKTDLDAVAIRRREIARFVSGYEAARAQLQAEIEELDVTKRVLTRIESLLHAETFPPNYVTSEPIHRRAMGVLKSLIPGRGE